MDLIALYYPYIHVRDETWLKYAALYWPKMARLRPRRFRTVDSRAARALRDARWLIDVQPPAWAAAQVGESFLAVISSRAHALRDRFSLDRIEEWDAIAAGISQSGHAGHRVSQPLLDPRLGHVHASKIDPTIVDAAVDAGLAVRESIDVDGTEWVGMHPELASVYTSALIERIAVEDHLHPVTDQSLSHAALSGWTVERLVQVLLDECRPETRSPHDLTDAFVLLAFETVVPADLDKVPIEKIIEIRAMFGAELDVFREYVTEQAERLAELEDVRDVVVFQEYLHTEVRRTIEEQRKQLRERLRSVGLDSVKALANVKSVAMPPLAALAAGTMGLPPEITGPATLAACVVTAPGQWRRHRATAIRESPAGYLFRIDQALNPATLLDRIRRVWPT